MGCMDGVSGLTGRNGLLLASMLPDEDGYQWRCSLHHSASLPLISVMVVLSLTHPEL